MYMWIFSDSRDTDFGEDDSSGVRFQPDHFPNILRPGGGYHKDTIVNSEKPEVFCNKCDDELVDGSCVRCDWGEQNRAVPMPNYPLDPFRDDKAGIRAGSWKFGMANIAVGPEEWVKRLEEQGFITDKSSVENGIQEYRLQVEKENEKRKQEGRNLVKPQNSNATVNATCLNGHSVKTRLNDPRCKLCADEGKIINPEEWVKRLEEQGFITDKSSVENGIQEYKEKRAELNKEKEEKGEGILRTLDTAQANVNAICPNGHATKTPLGTPGCKTCGYESKKISPTEWVQRWDSKGFITNENNVNEGIKELKANQADKYRNISEAKIKGMCKRKNHPVETFLGDPTCGECWKEERKVTLNAISSFMEDENFKNTIQSLIEEKTSNGQFSVNSRKSIYKKICKKFPEFKDKVSSASFTSSKIFNQIVENYQFDRAPGIGTFIPTAPAVVYVFQDRGGIKVGITNDIDARIEEYKNPQRPIELQPLQGDGRSKKIVRQTPSTAFPEYVELPTNLPDEETLRQRGLEPLDKEVSRANRVHHRERRREVVNNPHRFPPIKKSNSQNNLAFVSEPMTGYIAQAIEKNIMDWWISLNLSPELQAANYTETIAVDPSAAVVNNMDIGSDLTLDLHVFLIKKMIENGGHMENLAATFDEKFGGNPEDKKVLSGFFDNNSNKINAAFGMTWDAEQGKYVPGNDFGEALGIDEAYIPASNWSFEESVEKPTEEQVQNIQTQRAMQLSEDQQKALQAPQLSPSFYGDQRFQEELAKHPEWSETAIPETQIPQDLRSVPRGDYNNFEGIRVNQPYRDPINEDVRMIDENNQQWIVYNGQWVRVAKIQDLWTGF